MHLVCCIVYLISNYYMFLPSKTLSRLCLKLKKVIKLCAFRYRLTKQLKGCHYPKYL